MTRSHPVDPPHRQHISGSSHGREEASFNAKAVGSCFVVVIPSVAAEPDPTAVAVIIAAAVSAPVDARAADEVVSPPPRTSSTSFFAGVSAVCGADDDASS
jgi:hypothetical protein